MRPYISFLSSDSLSFDCPKKRKLVNKNSKWNQPSKDQKTKRIIIIIISEVNDFNLNEKKHKTDSEERKVTDLKKRS
jgi:hypothetical protein